jgi:hypothetical protein
MVNAPPVYLSLTPPSALPNICASAHRLLPLRCLHFIGDLLLQIDYQCGVYRYFGTLIVVGFPGCG